MQQRVAIARALALDPAVLLMDEPFAALDEITRDRMAFELMRLWHLYRRTVLFVTHSLAEAVFLSDRVVLMSARPGRIHQTFEIDLPRPRDRETRLTDRFHQIVSELNRELYRSGMSVQNYGAAPRCIGAPAAKCVQMIDYVIRNARCAGASRRHDRHWVRKRPHRGDRIKTFLRTHPPMTPRAASAAAVWWRPHIHLDKSRIIDRCAGRERAAITTR